jgi:potassium efflux system protein
MGFMFLLFTLSRRSPACRRTFRQHARPAWLAVGTLLLWLSVAATPVRAQAVTAGADSPPAPADVVVQTPAHRSADIPARADADEQDVQAIVHRAQAPDAALRYEEALARHANAIHQLAERSGKSDLAVLSVRRLESLQRHWLLYERSVAQTRAELARTINAQSEDVSDLANRRAAWQATAHAAGLPPALRERVEELIARIDDAEKLLSVPLARLLDLGRTGGALATQVQQGTTAVSSMVEDQDRRLVSMDTPPLWLALRDAASRSSR